MAATASLRRSFEPHSDGIDVTWAGGVQLALLAGGRQVLAGPWDIAVAVDGRSLDDPSRWDCVLWHSDGDCDYLELQASPREGVVIERQILLSRNEGFAHLAVKVAGLPGPDVTVASRWSLASATIAVPDRETRELSLRSEQVRAARIRVFPLGLPQDRSVSSPGELVVKDGQLELRQAGAGTGLYAPLNLNLDEKRRRQPADWRTLTVAEEGAVLPRDRAAAQRLRIGLEHQLLVYHNLYPSRAGRSVLGHNTRHETLIGLFSDRGDVTPVMAVE